MKKPVVLTIMDGFGINPEHNGNAIFAANTPRLDKIFAECAVTQIGASGLDVGLPDGQMGNSEVGHTNIGAGRVVYQELTRITKSISDGDFFENAAFSGAIENCRKNGGALHLMGLLSDGGVHSHNTHLYALVKLAKQSGLDRVFDHGGWRYARHQHAGHGDSLDPKHRVGQHRGERRGVRYVERRCGSGDGGYGRFRRDPENRRGYADRRPPG